MIQENPDMACNTNVIRKAISEARNRCFTLNNYTDDEIKQLKNDIPILCAIFIVTGKQGAIVTGKQFPSHDIVTGKPVSSHEASQSRYVVV